MKKVIEKQKTMRIKCIFDTHKKGAFCQNCYNGHFTKDCKLLISFVSDL
jgi:hypothetical protein